MIIIAALLVAAVAAIAAISIHAAQSEIAEQIKGERIARWLSQYHYPSGRFRPDSWHPDRGGDNRHTRGQSEQ
jgi:prenyltransferase beta subunit